MAEEKAKKVEEKPKKSSPPPADDMREKKPEGGMPAEAGKGGGKAAFYGILAGIVALNLVLAFVLVRITMPKPAVKEDATVDSLSAEPQERTEMGATTAEAPISALVNIAGTDGKRFLKVGVVFEYDPTDKKLAEEIEMRKPRFKSMLIEQLSTMTLVELNEPDTKEKICREFLRRVNSTFPKHGGKVTEVFLDDFIIQ